MSFRHWQTCVCLPEQQKQERIPPTQPISFPFSVDSVCTETSGHGNHICAWFDRSGEFKSKLWCCIMKMGFGKWKPRYDLWLLSPAILFAMINQHETAHLSAENKEQSVRWGTHSVHTIFSWYLPDGLKYIIMHLHYEFISSHARCARAEHERTIVILIRH